MLWVSEPPSSTWFFKCSIYAREQKFPEHIQETADINVHDEIGVTLPYYIEASNWMLRYQAGQEIPFEQKIIHMYRRFI